MSKLLTPKGWKDLIEHVVEDEIVEDLPDIEVSEELSDFIDHLIEEGILEGSLEESTLGEVSYKMLQRYKDKAAHDKRGHSTLYGKGKKRDRGIALATRKQQGKTGTVGGSDTLSKGPDKPVKVPASGRRQYAYKPGRKRDQNISKPGMPKHKPYDKDGYEYHPANVEPRGHTSIQYPAQKIRKNKN